VDKSLVTTVGTGDEPRYRLLQTLAQYGREQLASAPDLVAVQARHARYVAAIVDAPDRAHGSAIGNWYATVTDSIDDVRQAMDWAIEHGDANVACTIAGALGWYWNMGGRMSDT